MSRPYFVRAVFLTAASAFLAACGGGSSSDDPAPTEPGNISDSELRDSFNNVATQTAFDVDRDMGFPAVQTYTCDADGLIQVQSEGERRFCITLKEDADRVGAPAVSPDEVDFYLELPPMTRADFEQLLTTLQSGSYDGDTLPFTPVLIERLNREMEIGSLVELNFDVAQAGYGSCEVYNQSDDWVTSIDSLDQQGNQLSGTLPANLSVGTYEVDCEFTNTFGTFPSGSSASDGVPAAATVEITSNSDNAPDLKTLYFDPESAVLSSEGRSLLIEYDAYMANNPGVELRLEGHADTNETDSREESMQLGERRADAAADFLVIRGVARSRLEVVSYGEERPVAEGSSESEKALNRRVEILVQ